MDQKQDQTQSSIIFITNLDLDIKEDYLYGKFKSAGEIHSLKISKNNQTKKSKGQAFISYANSAFANQAIKNYNNTKILRNTIKVQLYSKLKLQHINKASTIFINNLPYNTDSNLLKELFNQYREVVQVQIFKNKEGQQLNYGIVEFQHDTDFNEFLKFLKKTIVFQGRQIKIEQYKTKFERDVKSSSIYINNFTYPIPQEYFNQKNISILSAIEFAWTLIIKDYFIQNQIGQIKNCSVNYDKVTKKPTAHIQFDNLEQGTNYSAIYKQKNQHPCIQSCAQTAIKLLKQNTPPIGDNGKQQFNINEVINWFEQMVKDKRDIFQLYNFNSQSNMSLSTMVNPDDRFLIIQNINQNITEQQIEDFLGQFGKIVKVSMNTRNEQQFKTQQCFVQFEKIEDSKNARSDIYDNKLCCQTQQQKNLIFKNGNVIINILLAKNLRKEFLKIKANSKGTFQFKRFLQPPIKFDDSMFFQPVTFKTTNLRPGPQKPPQSLLTYGNRSSNDRYSLNYLNNISQYAQKSSQIPLRPIQQRQILAIKEKNIEEDFPNYQTIIDKIDDFQKFPQQKQRQHLGDLLFKKVALILKNNDLTKRIVGMLIDPANMDINDILNLFEETQELNEYLEEAKIIIENKR